MNKNEKKEDYQRVEILVPGNEYDDISAAAETIIALLNLDVVRLKKCTTHAEIVNRMTEIKLDLGKFYGLASQVMKERLKNLEHTV